MGYARQTGRSGGFTLVEVLVVIGIIGMLMSILLPTIAGARRRVATIQCAANLRTIGQAWQQYASSNRGTCVPGRLPTGGAPGGVFDVGYGAEYRPRWYELLAAELKIKLNQHPSAVEDDTWLVRHPTFLCPAVSDFNNSRNYPYGYNHQFLGNARPVMTGTGAYIRYPVKVTSVSGAQTVVAADSMGVAAGKTKGDRHGYEADGKHDTFAVLSKGYFIDPPRLTKTSDYADSLYRQPTDRSGPDPRHQNRSNVLFADGHVTLMAPQDMGYGVDPGGAMRVEGSDVTNTLFSGTGRDSDPPSINGQ